MLCKFPLFSPTSEKEAHKLILTHRGACLVPTESANTTASRNRLPGDPRRCLPRIPTGNRRRLPQLSICKQECFLPRTLLEARPQGSQNHLGGPGCSQAFQTPGNPVCLCRVSGKEACPSPHWEGQDSVRSPRRDHFHVSGGSTCMWTCREGTEEGNSCELRVSACLEKGR